MARKRTKSTPPRKKTKHRTPEDNPHAALPARALARRQVLKGVVAGGGVVASTMALPKEWTKPVVQSIVASAHAQVSPLPPLPGSTTSTSNSTSTTSPPVVDPIFVPVPVGPFSPVSPLPPPTDPIFVPVPIGSFGN